MELNVFGEAVATNNVAALYYGNLGNALLKRQRLDEAVACYRRAIDLRPDFSEVHSNLGYVLRKQGRLSEAVVYLRKAIDLNPHNPKAHYNLGEPVEKQGRLEEAATCCRRAIDLKPDFSEAHANLAMALLARGDMAEEWQEYEQRLKTPEGMKCSLNFTQPQWRGESANGRTLLIHAEQGYGDTLQFCR